MLVRSGQKVDNECSITPRMLARTALHRRESFASMVVLSKVSIAISSREGRSVL